MEVNFLLAHASSKQIDVTFFCVCPLSEDKLRHNIVKVAVEITSQRLLWQCYDEIYHQYEGRRIKKTDVNLFFKLPKWLIAGLKWGEPTQTTALDIDFIQIDANIVETSSRFLMGYLTATVKKI